MKAQLMTEEWLEVRSVISANITIQPKQNYVAQQNETVVLRILLACIKTEKKVIKLPPFSPDPGKFYIQH